MKFPRNAKIFRGQLDAAPVAAVFFLLIIFMMLANRVYTPGIPMRLQLPLAADVPGTDKPSVAIAVDASGRIFYQNQLTERRQLRLKLQEVAKQTKDLVLIIQADRSVTHEDLVRLAIIAREAGVSEARLATMPRPLPQPAPKRQP